MAQLAGEGFVLTQRGSQPVDDGRVRRQHAVGSGVTLARQREGLAAVVGRAEQDDQFGLACGLRRMLPHVGIDRAPARIVDVRAEHADRLRPVDGRFGRVGGFQVILQQAPQSLVVARVAGAGQCGRAIRGAAIGVQHFGAAGGGAAILQHRRRV